MSSRRVDDILELLDNALESGSYQNLDCLSRPDACWRCNKNDREKGRDLCAACRAWMLGETDEAPPGTSLWHKHMRDVRAQIETTGGCQLPAGLDASTGDEDDDGAWLGYMWQDAAAAYAETMGHVHPQTAVWASAGPRPGTVCDAPVTVTGIEATTEHIPTPYGMVPETHVRVHASALLEVVDRHPLLNSHLMMATGDRATVRVGDTAAEAICVASAMTQSADTVTTVDSTWLLVGAPTLSDGTILTPDDYGRALRAL